MLCEEVCNQGLDRQLWSKWREFEYSNIDEFHIDGWCGHCELNKVFKLLWDIGWDNEVEPEVLLLWDNRREISE
jgi:hypothetical protein